MTDSTSVKSSDPSSKRAGEESAAVPDAKKNKSMDSDVPPQGEGGDFDDDDEDDLAEIDESNIISGARTRGKKIDFTKIADEGVDEDDEDDEDVVVGDESKDLEDDEDSHDEDEDEEADDK
ncbi:Hypothetical protein MELLADRAFT_76210 [Melampsora larici-populina 98AG31]|uniref:Histone chaperone domain-containing protein n=1 Tax=Melampsora larici-populina (strain 98AG31 / pathotype 3-4-7) TaxID=747676 RepID=F4R308_MELLP|nr:Hypothetical protein MELLADRAFT_76210 [Melampsora larici-populina 98AG31]EGG12546.1 Hypothetical protein MELLADRAFT_76210 [Melampsora larici-populina 98AG31]